MTVVIPTCGRWNLLSTTLSGALQQEGVDLEVIVVDDGSSDETEARLSEIDKRTLRVLRNGAPQGVARARNRGIGAARGDWVAFLDDDDLWAPHKLRAQLASASYSGANWAYARAVSIDAHHFPVGAETYPDHTELMLLLLERSVIPGGGSNVIARTEVVRRIGGFDENLSVLADWDLWLRLAAAGMPAACEEILVGYRLHSANMHVQGSDRRLADEFRYLSSKHSELARAHGVSFDWLALFEWRAVGERRAGRRVQAARAYLRAAVAARSAAMIVRAFIVLFGESAMDLTRRLLRRPPSGQIVPQLPWLEHYRKRSGGV